MQVWHEIALMKLSASNNVAATFESKFARCSTAAGHKERTWKLQKTDSTYQGGYSISTIFGCIQNVTMI
jgi:hypothetical protein